MQLYWRHSRKWGGSIFGRLQAALAVDPNRITTAGNVHNPNAAALGNDQLRFDTNATAQNLAAPSVTLNEGVALNDPFLALQVDLQPFEVTGPFTNAQATTNIRELSIPFGTFERDVQIQPKRFG